MSRRTDLLTPVQENRAESVEKPETVTRAKETSAAAEEDAVPAREEEAVRNFRIRRPLLWTGALVAAALLAMLLSRPLWGSWPQSGVPEHFTAALQTDGGIDLNRADAAALCTLPGIGESRAAAILEWREKNGGFSSVEELLQVPGIGEKTLETLRERVFVDAAETAEKTD